MEYSLYSDRILEDKERKGRELVENLKRSLGRPLVFKKGKFISEERRDRLEKKAELKGERKLCSILSKKMKKNPARLGEIAGLLLEEGLVENIEDGRLVAQYLALGSYKVVGPHMLISPPQFSTGRVLHRVGRFEHFSDGKSQGYRFVNRVRRLEEDWF